MANTIHPETLLQQKHGLVVPAVQPPRASYLKAVKSGNLLFLSGHGTSRDGRHTYVGKLGREFGVEEGQQAAQVVALNLLATIKDQLGDLDAVVRFVKLLCFVNSDPEFTETYKVANGASDLIADIFGPERAPHARTAIGTATLPFGMAVEIEGVVEFRV